MPVLRGQRLLGLQLAGVQEILVREAVVLALQIRLRHEKIANTRSKLPGRIGKFLQRIKNNRDDFAHRFHVVESGIGVQEEQGQQGKKTETGE